MIQFALLDENGTVTLVLEGRDEDDGREAELCERTGQRYVQTAYDGSTRRRYAGIGMTYFPEHDAFILPQPYLSWTLDLDDPSDWVPPVAKPTDEGYWYEWDEGNLTWIAHEILDESTEEE